MYDVFECFQEQKLKLKMQEELSQFKKQIKEQKEEAELKEKKIKEVSIERDNNNIVLTLCANVQMKC